MEEEEGAESCGGSGIGEEKVKKKSRISSGLIIFCETKK
jgi:hypothetical protein